MIDQNNETIDDLMCGYHIIQHKINFRFSMDAVLLAHFVTIKKNDYVVDFCAGSGVIGLLVAAHHSVKKITSIEIQQSFASLINRSIALNNIQDTMDVICDDLANASILLGYGAADVVTCNPPYLKIQTGKTSINDSINISRREVKTNLEDIFLSATKVLKNKGRFAMIHQAARADEISALMKQYNIPVKRARLIQPNINESPNLILVEGIKNSSTTIKWLPTLHVYHENEYTDEIKEIYGQK
ncbi:MAG: methyltransferase [Clostridiales bacterium]|nr:methyltransferase [Clostridiales bacterium]